MKIIYFLLFLFWSLLSYAQQLVNLIPNGSFELKNSCPTGIILDPYVFNNMLVNWKAENHNGFRTDFMNVNSPDYYHRCATSNTVSIPQSQQSFQEPVTGDAYIALGVSYNTIINRYYCEYVFTRLLEPLIQGQEYSFSMFVSLNDATDVAINKYGAVFITRLPFENQHITTNLIMDSNIQPQVFSEGVINNKEEWKELSGTFTANGGEEYVLLGMFYPREQLQIESLDETPYVDNGYFSTMIFIDEVSLYKGRVASNEEFNNLKIKIFPNPTNNLVTIEGIALEEIKTLELFDMKGVKLMGISNELKMDISSLASGSYLLKITNSEDNTLSKKIIKK